MRKEDVECLMRHIYISKDEGSSMDEIRFAKGENFDNFGGKGRYDGNGVLMENEGDSEGFGGLPATGGNQWKRKRGQ